jgi:transposase-like protein
MVNLIGVSGKIGSGKDTVGKIIQFLTSENRDDRELGSFLQTEEFLMSPYTIKKFAGKLKDTACLILGCTRTQLESHEFKASSLGPEWGHMSVRTFLQRLGTEAGRHMIHQNIWVNATFADYNKYCKWLFTDMRFENERMAILKRDGITIRVNRYCYDSAEDFLVTNPDAILSNAAIELVKANDMEAIKKMALSNGYVPIIEQHPSETALDHATFDYVIDNNSTIEDLVEKVKVILIENDIIKK